jgi:DNA-nicking Smr family endonuclease
MKDSDEDDFSSLVGPVRRLQHDRIEPPRRHPRTRPRRPPAPAVASRPVADRDEPPQRIVAEWFDHGLQKKLSRRIRRGELRVDAHLDLHGLRRNEALQQLDEFLDLALADGCRFVVIVHGQGYGSRAQAVLKPLTRHWLSQQDAVLAWCPAQARHGGGGATYAYLRRAASGKPDP